MLSLRIDRLMTLYVSYPMIRKVGTNKDIGIPILMYHSISNNDKKNVQPYYEINTSIDIFSDHMKFLYENEYSVINIYDFVDYMKGIKNINNNCAVITFD